MSKPYTQLIPANTDDVWEIHDVPRMTVIGLPEEVEADPDEQRFIVVDPNTRRILTTPGSQYSDLGPAIRRAILLSQNQAEMRAILAAKARERVSRKK